MVPLMVVVAAAPHHRPAAVRAAFHGLQQRIFVCRTCLVKAIIFTQEISPTPVRPIIPTVSCFRSIPNSLSHRQRRLPAAAPPAPEQWNAAVYFCRQQSSQQFPPQDCRLLPGATSEQRRQSQDVNSYLTCPVHSLQEKCRYQISSAFPANCGFAAASTFHNHLLPPCLPAGQPTP